MGFVCADEREDISRIDSDKFGSIITEVESLHKFGEIFLSIFFEIFPFSYYKERLVKFLLKDCATTL